MKVFFSGIQIGKKPIFLLDLPCYQFLWLYSEDTSEENLKIGKKLNDNN